MNPAPNTATTSYLRKYTPFAETDEAALIVIADSAKHINLHANEVLFNLGGVDDLCYLLESGRLELEAADGKKRTIEEGTLPALSPIAILKPRKYKVTALSECRLITVRDQSLKIAKKGLLASNIEKKEISEFLSAGISWGLVDTFNEKTLNDELMIAIKNQKLPLVSIPKISTRINQLVDSDASNTEIAKHISMDPAIATKLIAISNNVFYQANKICTDLPTAISKIGTKVVKQLVISLLLKDKFNSKDKELNQILIETWQEGIEVSALCFAIASQLPTFQKDKALLSGLIHNIGCLPIIKFLEQKNKILTSEDIKIILKHSKNEAGKILLNTWSFSEDLVCIPENADQWLRDHNGPADYLDLVLLSQLLYKKTHKISHADKCVYESLPELITLPAYKKITDLDKKINLLEIMETSAKDQINAIRQLLK